MAYDLDAVDRHIITILQQDGRTANVEIARRVGISEATVRKRLERLIADCTIRVAAVPNAIKVGLSTVTFITLHVDLSFLDRIAERLARAPEVRSLYYTTGESDLVVEAWFRSNEDLLRFLTHEIASIPGIKQAATSHVLRTLKDGSMWVLPSESSPCVLVVDDDPDFCEVVRVALTAEGFQVACAHNGSEALAAMRVAKPDLVILDVMMQGILDGLRTSKTMRADGDLRSVPILMVSSITQSAFAGLLPKEMSLPADNFMAKPIEMPQLIAEVKHLMRTS
jgi:Lrp/AsnC family transcriptional regulator for asnA, asnC and gidA